MSDRDLREEHGVQRKNDVFTLSESLDMPVGKTLWYTAEELCTFFIPPRVEFTPRWRDILTPTECA